MSTESVGADRDLLAPQCAHLRVTYRTEPVQPGDADTCVATGGVRGHWQCDLCETRFAPTPLAEHLIEALEGKLAGCRAAYQLAKIRVDMLETALEKIENLEGDSTSGRIAMEAINRKWGPDTPEADRVK